MPDALIGCGVDIEAEVAVRPHVAFVRVWLGLWPLAVLRDAEHCVGMHLLCRCRGPIERSTLSMNDRCLRVDPPFAWGWLMRISVIEGCYLVDPASSHMLVSKIKPCMCKYELIQTVKLRMAH